MSTNGSQLSAIFDPTKDPASFESTRARHERVSGRIGVIAKDIAVELALRQGHQAAKAKSPNAFSDVIGAQCTRDIASILLRENPTQTLRTCLKSF